MTDAATGEMWTFDRFEPGQVFGTVEIATSGEKRAQWAAVFGAGGDRLPRGMMVTAMMEAYVAAIQPRPDGNVHVSQELTYTDLPVHWGDTLSVTVSCADKEEKKGRFWVRFGIDATVGGQTALTGVIRAIWAA